MTCSVHACGNLLGAEGIYVSSLAHIYISFTRSCVLQNSSLIVSRIFRDALLVFKDTVLNKLALFKYIGSQRCYIILEKLPVIKCESPIVWTYRIQISEYCKKVMAV